MHTCTSFKPGHCIHWIQSSRARIGTPVVLRDPDRERFTVVMPDGSEHRWWNHDAVLVAEACAVGDALLCEPGPLIRASDGARLISLYPSLPPVPPAPRQTLMAKPGNPCSFA